MANQSPIPQEASAAEGATSSQSAAPGDAAAAAPVGAEAGFVEAALLNADAAAAATVGDALASAEQHLAALSPDDLHALTQRLSPEQASGAPSRINATATGDVTGAHEAAADDSGGRRGPGALRIDQVEDARTRAVLEFMARNHDATITDALAYVDARRAGAAQPAPGSSPAEAVVSSSVAAAASFPQGGAPAANPTTAGLAARIADLTAQIKARANPQAEGYDADALEDLREQRANLRVDLRFAQAAEEQQQRLAANAAAAAAVGGTVGAPTGFRPTPVPVVRANPPTAPGSSRLTPTGGPNPAQAAEQLLRADPDTLNRIMERAGVLLGKAVLPFAEA